MEEESIDREGLTRRDRRLILSGRDDEGDFPSFALQNGLELSHGEESFGVGLAGSAGNGNLLFDQAFGKLHAETTECYLAHDVLDPEALILFVDAKLGGVAMG